MNVSPVAKAATLAGLAIAGGGIGAGIAALTPTRNEQFQTVASAIAGGVGLAGGLALMKTPWRDGGIAAVLLGAVALAGGAAATGAAAGSHLIDRSN